MRYFGFSLLFLVLLTIGSTQLLVANNKIVYLPLYPNDSILDRITNIDMRLKQFTAKDTTGGFSSPRKIEMSSYLDFKSTKDEKQRDRAGLIVLPLEYEPFLSYMNFIDTILIAPEMLPPVFEGKLLPRRMDFRKPEKDMWHSYTPYLIDKDSIVSPNLYEYKERDNKHYSLIDKDSTFNSRIWKSDRTRFIRREYYTNYPQRIKLNALAFDGSPIIKGEVEKRNPFKELVTAGDAIAISKPDISKFEVKQVFWKKWGEHKLDVAQKSYTENWNPKTNNSFQVQSYHKFNAKYRKNKIEFNHELEWRLNAQSISLPSEDKEKNPDYNDLLINDDWLRTYNKLGLDAFIRKWSYIFTLEAKTPVFIKREQNDKHKRQAAFLSPLEVNFGLGAGYTYENQSKKVKDRKVKIAIDATPLSVNLKHVGSTKVWETNKHGVVYEDKADDKDKDPKDRRSAQRRYTKTEIGSTINMTFDYKFNSYASLYSRSKYFTNYERAYLEFENTIKLQLNRYLATSFYLYMRYDDSVGTEKKDPKWKYFSYNQVLGFGLSYNW